MLGSQQEKKQFNETSEVIKTENKKPIKMLKDTFYS